MSNEKPKAVWHMKITSSNLDECWYRPETKQLRLKFKKSGTYMYLDVSLKEFYEFSVADSQGQYFDKVLKAKPYKKV